MILLRKIAVVGTAAAVLACHDSAGPPGLPAGYMLTTINGRALPTSLAQFPESPVVNWGSLQLDAAGTAVITENRLTMIAPGNVTYTTNYTYTIRDGRIVFHFDCPPTAICSSPPVGIFSGSHLFLTYEGADGDLLYDYELAPVVES